MRRDVDAPALLAHTQLAQDPADSRLLSVHRDLDIDGLRPRGRLGHQRGQRPRQRVEDRLHALRRQPVVVVGQQRVVGMAAVVEARRVLAREGEVALERRRQEGEVRAGARVLPHRLPLGGRLHARGGEIGRDAAPAIPVAPRHAHDVAVHGAQIAVALDLLQPRADVVSGRALVQEALQRSELLRPRRGARRRHHRALVPGGQATERGEVGQLGQPLAQGLQGGHPRQATRRPPIGDPRVMDAAFHGFGPDVFTWFDGLERDNSKAYFTATREHYEANVRGGLQAMLEELTRTFGGEVKVFRQQRNLRFAPAGSAPYKTRTYGLLHGVRGPAAALYAELSAHGLYAGTGYHQLARDQLERFRTAIVDGRSGPRLAELVAAARAGGLDVVGESLRTAPRGYPREHPRGELLRHKALVAGRSLPGAAGIGRDDALENVAATWRAVEPLNAWLEKHVGASTMPGRLP